MPMELMPEPMALPGCCFKCRTGSSSRDFFIDFDFSMDDFGAIYICNECLAEMAHTAGFVTPVEAQALKDRAKKIQEENEALVVRIFGLEQAIDGLRIAGSGAGIDSEPDDDDSVLTESEESPEGTGDMEQGEGEPSEPLHDEGVAELSDDDNSDSTEFSFGSI